MNCHTMHLSALDCQSSSPITMMFRRSLSRQNGSLWRNQPSEIRPCRLPRCIVQKDYWKIEASKTRAQVQCDDRERDTKAYPRGMTCLQKNRPAPWCETSRASRGVRHLQGAVSAYQKRAFGHRICRFLLPNHYCNTS